MQSLRDVVLRKHPIETAPALVPILQVNVNGRTLKLFDMPWKYPPPSICRGRTRSATEWIDFLEEYEWNLSEDEFDTAYAQYHRARKWFAKDCAHLKRQLDEFFLGLESDEDSL